MTVLADGGQEDRDSGRCRTRGSTCDLTLSPSVPGHSQAFLEGLCAPGFPETCPGTASRGPCVFGSLWVQGCPPPRGSVKCRGSTALRGSWAVRFRTPVTQPCADLGLARGGHEAPATLTSRLLVETCVRALDRRGSPRAEGLAQRVSLSCGRSTCSPGRPRLGHCGRPGAV